MWPHWKRFCPASICPILKLKFSVVDRETIRAFNERVNNQTSWRRKKSCFQWCSDKKRDWFTRECIYIHTHTRAYIFKKYTAHLVKFFFKLFLQYVSWEITIVGNVSICLARPFLCSQERFLCQETDRCEDAWRDKVWRDGRELTN